MPGNPLCTRPPEVGTGGRVMRERTRAPFFQRVLKLVSRGRSGGLLVNAIFAHLLDQRRALQRQQTRGFRNDAGGKVARDVDLFELARLELDVEALGRASCTESMCELVLIWVVAEELKKKQ